MNIKHLVLPGGGSNFFTFYGMIRELHKENIWKYDTLSSIHCTSCGSILAFIVLLKLEWSIIDNYIINRPWETVYTITPEMCLDMMQSKGLIDIEFLYIFTRSTSVSQKISTFIENSFKKPVIILYYIKNI